MQISFFLNIATFLNTFNINDIQAQRHVIGEGNTYKRQQQKYSVLCM